MKSRKDIKRNIENSFETTFCNRKNKQMIVLMGGNKIENIGKVVYETAVWGQKKQVPQRMSAQAVYR